MRRRYISLFNYESKYFSLYNCNVFKILVGICACSPMHWIELYSFEIQPCHLCFCAMPAQSRPVGCLPHFAGELASIMFQGAMACLGLTVVSERAHCLAGSQPGAVFKCGCFLSWRLEWAVSMLHLHLASLTCLLNEETPNDDCAKLFVGCLC